MITSMIDVPGLLAAMNSKSDHAAVATNSVSNDPRKRNVDSETFMTLLVAQMKNQDPLSPQDGTAFVAQLAQFNQLEQLININDKLETLLNRP